MHLLNRAGSAFVALETTLLVHGVPRDQAATLARDLADAVAAGGARPAFVGVLAGRPIVGLTDDELQTLIDAPSVEKANTSNLGIALHRRIHAATTVSTTVELAARAGLRVMATGGIGGVHRGYDRLPDISADLGALARYPVAVVTSGVKSLLDVAATREVLETLGVPVIGFRTDSFPAFYVRETEVGVDARIDDPAELAALLGSELARTGRGIVVANPCPEGEAMGQGEWEALLARAAAAVGGRVSGRSTTPALLSQIHAHSGGRSLRANIALAKANARLAGELCAQMQIR